MAKPTGKPSEVEIIHDENIDGYEVIVNGSIVHRGDDIDAFDLERVCKALGAKVTMTYRDYDPDLEG